VNPGTRDSGRVLRVILVIMTEPALWRYLITGPWVVFVAYWLIGAWKTRRTVSQESFASRYGVLFLEISGYVLLFTGLGRVGVLDRRPVASTYPLATAGLAFTWIGIALAIWARRHLGRYWSARVTVKEDHKLIRTGPYAHLRNPIYSGLDLAAIGGVLAIDKWGCVAGAVLLITAYWIKAKKEESMLSAQFGEAFEEHRRRTGFLFPKF
jgi:protein-S-isoprenylcysteine O-methyltransferase Ste14